MRGDYSKKSLLLTSSLWITTFFFCAFDLRVFTSGLISTASRTLAAGAVVYPCRDRGGTGDCTEVFALVVLTVWGVIKLGYLSIFNLIGMSPKSLLCCSEKRALSKCLIWWIFYLVVPPNNWSSSSLPSYYKLSFLDPLVFFLLGMLYLMSDIYTSYLFN